MVASGELYTRPAIHLWDSNTMMLLSSIKQGLSRGVDHLAFSPSGTMLLASTMDDFHSIIIFVSQSPNKYDMSVIYPVGKDTYTSLIWVNDSDFVSVGSGHFNYWELGDEDSHNQLTAKFDDGKGPQITCAAVCPNGDVVCGTSTGDLLVWKKQIWVKTLTAVHEGSLDALKISGPR
jgi:hypothetical protein